MASSSETSRLHVIDVMALDGRTSLSVENTGTYYSTSFVLPPVAVFGVEILTDISFGTVDILVSFEQSNYLPATEMAASNYFSKPYDIYGNDISRVFNLVNATAGYIYINFAPMVTKYGRFKYKGQGSNGTSSIIRSVKLCFFKSY